MSCSFFCSYSAYNCEKLYKVVFCMYLIIGKNKE